MSTDTYKKLESNRKIYRASVTKSINSVDIKLKTTPIDFIFLEENFKLLKVKANMI